MINNVQKIKVGRIEFLDGFRGIAILWVSMYHAYTRWFQFVPYGSKFAKFPLFETGWLGVYLFFMISGFVILMTLEKCKNFKEFILRRWLRLFPGMAISSVLIFCVAHLVTSWPIAVPRIFDMIPGLTFIDTDIWGILISHLGGKTNINSLDGSFWSLYVEMRFYIIFGLLYFILKKRINKRIPIFILMGINILYIITLNISNVYNIKLIRILLQLINLTGARYFGWFAIGAMLYLFYAEKKQKDLILAIVFSLISIVFLNVNAEIGGVVNYLAVIIIVIVFFSTIVWDKLKPIFSNKFLLFIGSISYPLYLIHENIMLSFIVQLNSFCPFIPSILLPVIPFAILVAIGYLISKYGEPAFKKLLRKFIRV